MSDSYEKLFGRTDREMQEKRLEKERAIRKEREAGGFRPLEAAGMVRAREEEKEKPDLSGMTLSEMVSYLLEHPEARQAKEFKTKEAEALRAEVKKRIDGLGKLSERIPSDTELLPAWVRKMLEEG